MSSRPGVAVAVPSYNHARYLPETLGSVLAQTLPPAELVVIDDGSTDDSVAVIERIFAAARTRPETRAIDCRLIVRPNRGISVTRNELFAATRAPLVAFLDSDDSYAPDRLERMVPAGPLTGPHFAVSGIDFASEPGGPDVETWRQSYRLMLGQSMAFPTAGFALLRSNFTITASNFLVSRDLFEAVGGFDGRIAIAQDWDFALQATRLLEPVFVPEPLLTYRLHGQNTSRDARERGDSELELIVSKLGGWILDATPNSLAPTPCNWPRFFRVFVHICAGIQGRPLGARFPEAILAPPDEGGPEHPREAIALRRLLRAARTQAPDFDEHPMVDLMTRCLATWMATAGARP